jgi:chemotaxis protein methyltransferase CheR
MTEDEEYRDFLQKVKDRYGYDFIDYSEASLKRRIKRFMMLENLKDIKAVAKNIFHDELYFEHFIQEITVNVTAMFRDHSFYKSLKKNVFSRLATYPYIKIWIAGCSTGEEVYSLAILLKEENLYKRSIIYATDINTRSLKIAKEGVYNISKMKENTTDYIKSGGSKNFSDYYIAKFNSVMFDKSLRENVVFSAHNLAVDKSFNEFNLIICRNVLIYFNRSLQNKVLNLFHESLADFGFLGLGDKESLLFCDKAKHFEKIDKKEKIYMKIK